MYDGKWIGKTKEYNIFAHKRAVTGDIFQNFNERYNLIYRNDFEEIKLPNIPLFASNNIWLTTVL